MLRNMIRELLKRNLARSARVIDDLTRGFWTLGMEPLGIGHSLAECLNFDRVLLLQYLSKIAIHSEGGRQSPGHPIVSYMFDRIAIAAVDEETNSRFVVPHSQRN
jgi:hypothetical protein